MMVPEGEIGRSASWCKRPYGSMGHLAHNRREPEQLIELPRIRVSSHRARMGKKGNEYG
jgi:hypothetical protein